MVFLSGSLHGSFAAERYGSPAAAVVTVFDGTGPDTPPGGRVYSDGAR